MRQDTKDIDWNSIRLAVCGGMSSSEASKAYGVSAVTIRKRASREKWPTPTVLDNKIAELQAQKMVHAINQDSKELAGNVTVIGNCSTRRCHT